MFERRSFEALIHAAGPFRRLLADKGYDANHFRKVLAERGAEAVIPSTPPHGASLSPSTLSPIGPRQIFG